VKKKIKAMAIGVTVTTGQTGEVVAAAVHVHIDAWVQIKADRAMKFKLGSTYKVKAEDLFQPEGVVG
jgi:hypothetical protein